MLAGFGSGLSRTIFIDEGKARDEPAGISDDMKGYCVLGSRNKHISIRRIMLCYGYEALKMRGFSTPRDWLGSSEIKWRF
ncbi:unnamed protein product [Linum tenue]|uniref:Uncharacterized protein n=1 Tax=Linum tenue TaxID=586396 RepID=A0AAV0J702_9ROSI|nr:unnamed protein product [Linum tenue]